MTIAFDGSEGLFTRLGKIGNILFQTNAIRGTTVPGYYDDLGDEYESDRNLVANLTSNLASYQSGLSGSLSDLRTIAQNTVVSMVNADNPQPDSNLRTALIELIRQLDANSESIEDNSVSGTATPDGNNNGDGEMVVSVKNKYGKTLEMALDEDIVFTCSADAQNGSTGVGIESWQGRGEATVSDKLSADWPAGSGCFLSLAAIPATSDFSAGNLIVNGDFESFTTNVPANWSVITGIAGTDFAQETSVTYQGSKALKLLSGGTNPKLAQAFDDSSTGTGYALEPNTVYHGCFWAKIDSAAGGGSFTVRFYDVTNSAAMTDDEGNANSATYNLPDLTGSFVAKTFSFRTPRTLPDSSRLEILGTSIPSSREVYIDHLTVCKASQTYANGPYVSIHSGATPFSKGDQITLAISNNYASQWATLGEILFDLNSLELVLPSDASETLPDSLIG